MHGRNVYLLFQRLSLAAYLGPSANCSHWYGNAASKGLHEALPPGVLADMSTRSVGHQEALRSNAQLVLNLMRTPCDAVLRLPLQSSNSLEGSPKHALEASV
jgi:hypothetical protein